MNIALFLSSDGIALAHRQGAGHWAMIGETALDVPDLSAALADLHALAVEREGAGFGTLLVLPDDQILYTSLTAPTADPDLTAYRIEDGLEGLTPYAVTELEYDWQVLEEDRVKIAVVARETLDEARSFAAQYGFEGTGFAAMPPMERFPGVPTFGLGEAAAGMGFDAEGIAFGPDTFGQSEPEPAPEPEPEPEPTPEPDPAPESDPEPMTEAESEVATAEPEALAAAPTPADPTPTDPAPEDPAPTPAPTPASAAPEADVETSPKAQSPSPAEAEQDAEPPATLNPFDLGASDGPVTPIDDPSVSGPITALPQDPAPATPDVPAEVIGDAGDLDDALPPAPSPAVLAARERARAGRGAPPAPGALDPKPKVPAPTPADSAPNAQPEPRPEPEAGRFVASRGPTGAPGGAGRSLSTPGGTGGPVQAPAAARGALVGQRSSRLGLAHPDGPSRTAPEAAAKSEPASAAPQTAQPTADSGAGQVPRLAEQLQRVRAASKSRPSVKASSEAMPPRPRVEITPQAATGMTGAMATRPSPFDGPPPASGGGSKTSRLAGLLGRGNGEDAKPAAPKPERTAAPKAASAAVASLGGLLTRRSKPDTPAPEAQTAAAEAAPAGAENFASGLLARKTVTPTGGSFKTGLVLTAILLLLLALVAIWSALFLPNSAVARLFGLGSDTVEVAAAPDVSSSAPAFGAPETALSEGAQPSLQDEAAADGIALSADGDAIAEAALDEDDAASVDTAALDEATLPDIDADLDLPPLPVIEQGQNPSPEEAEALYAEDGIWARSPERPDLRPFDLMDRVYTASIDPEISAFDAVALPDPGVNPGELLRRYPPPPAFGTEYDLTASGLVAATPNGVLTPEGAFVISGTPPQVAVRRPREVAPAAPEVNGDTAALGAVRPAERPEDLVETRERQILNGLTQVELGERRPELRPASPQEAAAQASLFAGGGDSGGDGGTDGDGADGPDPDAVNAAVEIALQGTDLAVAQSLLPRTRPGNIAQIVASADRTPTEAPTAVAAAAIAPAPAIPSNADVSRAATERNAIRLRNVNLIGVSGSSSDRRALVRLSSGRFVRVTVGDRLDGGRVAAIGETTLQYVRSGRTVTLEIPG